jgi:hypothetical protein
MMTSEKRRELQAKACARFWQWVFVLAAICFALLPLLLTSCSTQLKRSADGAMIANVNVFSRGSMVEHPDGRVDMRGDSTKAAEELGKYGDLLLKAGIIKTGIDAVGDVSQKAIDELTD